MALTVRRMSSEEDIDKLIELGRLMHAESGFSDWSFNADKLRAYGRHYIEHPDKGVGILCEDADGDVHAMVVAFVAEYFFSDDKYASDLCVYVRPDRRGGLAALRVMNEFERWGAEVGARCLMITPHARIDTDRAVKFFTGMGFDSGVPTLTKRIA